MTSMWKITMLSLALMVVLCDVTRASVWEHEIDPKIIIEQHPPSKVSTFLRNNTPYEALKVLHLTNQWALVGGKNTLYNLSLPSLEMQDNITWTTINFNDIKCKMRQRPGESCSNFIRIAIPTAPNELLVCGTHSYAPHCRQYTLKDGAYVVKLEYDAKNMAPFDETHETTSLYVNEKLFSGISAHDAQKHPILYQQPLRTKLNNIKQLNSDAKFVGSFALDEYAYFFLGESPLEYDGCGTRQLRGTVARVCINDPGAPTPNNNLWSTFIKTRLRCGLNSTLPFEFNNIQSISQPVLVDGKSHVVYVVFAAADTAAQASAICVYSVDQIDKALMGEPSTSFDRNLYASGYFKSLKTNHTANELGSCRFADKMAANKSMYLELNDPLVEIEVTPLMNDPVLLHLGFDYHYTSIAIDSQVRTLDDNKSVDVMFVGTSNGHVIKATNLAAYRASTPFVIEDIIVFDPDTAITGLRVHRVQKDNTTLPVSVLIAESKQQIKTIPLDNCEWIVHSCAKCVALQDPYCAWDKQQKICANAQRVSDPRHAVQNLISGDSNECPEMERNKKASMKMNKHDILRVGPNGPIEEPGDNPSQMYTKKTVATVGTLSSIFALLAGFAAGFIYNQRKKRDMSYFNYR